MIMKSQVYDHDGKYTIIRWKYTMFYLKVNDHHVFFQIKNGNYTIISPDDKSVFLIVYFQDRSLRIICFTCDQQRPHHVHLPVIVHFSHILQIKKFCEGILTGFLEIW